MRMCAKLLWGGVLISSLVLSAVACSDSDPAETDVNEIAAVRQLLADEKYIIHAGGRIADASGKAFSYTNSKDALENCYAQGNRVSELDFRISSDNCLVCTHEWTMMYLDGVAAENVPMTKDEFLRHKTHGGFTSMWLGDLVSFLEQHPDFYFVTDIKDNNVAACKILASYCPAWKDHFIIQIYHASEYDAVRALGFRNIIYTLYAASAAERQVDELIAFVAGHDILGYTYWAAPYDWTDIYLQAFVDAGITSYVHTVNDKAQRTYFLQNGVSAVYTDVVDNE